MKVVGDNPERAAAGILGTVVEWGSHQKQVGSLAVAVSIDWVNEAEWSGWRHLGEAIVGVERSGFYHLCDRWVSLAVNRRCCSRSIAIRVGWVVVEALLSSTCLVAVIVFVQPASSPALHVQSPSVRLHLARRRTPVGPASVRSSSIVQLEYWRRACL